jgi:hypothetical protein
MANEDEDVASLTTSYVLAAGFNGQVSLGHSNTAAYVRSASSVAMARHSRGYSLAITPRLSGKRPSAQAVSAAIPSQRANRPGSRLSAVNSAVNGRCFCGRGHRVVRVIAVIVTPDARDCRYASRARIFSSESVSLGSSVW